MKIPIITGPTASGKSDIVLKLAEDLNAEIICMDSRQIYKEINIGTAKPNIYEMQKIKHHLFDIIDLKESFNAYEYVKLVDKTIKNIILRNKIPILTGGTGFYIDALTKGFFNVENNYSIRKYLENISLEKNLYQILKQIDIDSYNRIHKNDKKRIIRALEIFLNTGKTMTYHMKKSILNKSNYDFQIIVLNRDRKNLHDRINKRVDKMIENGLIEEVKSLKEKGYDPNLNALNTIGYKEVFKYLDYNCDLKDTVENIKTNTRRYARRQIIYFRHIKEAIWVELSSNNEENKNKLIQIIKGGF
ncbi:tRNA (adenosine(37)-N6)-dimethylallyltransferase MiaA [Oceanotoga sp. DSM 15011]|jgi:tRNA dimethylallyltransferase|uniref:tRNA dimethylallyltransferase n=1 Tax=Oceanotoga teriensis TaxID=515440 RepID=A0AA45C5G4_9BACT|nr:MULTISPECIES: tRNA (adenosine(37)-N6)-dimethylallyltransferase MiaA [Oceanotoga]MDN5342300.1 tRNA dimethylallyltransferase [Oceanotoga sp.]MDO7977363.1 tRNA (adenosine(37)-N6)-dimethylallyltransferase MiaA [Oceanotoga teriensis]PWJ88753.1 tRNA dimethylallyltransferase [Oceanotoga teriensis]UYP00420.1 tRNA (adenosine(37)-N6)-dimethylallyltransferase MiaA [Oceanotoga sp. DSM 15011]